MPIMMQCPQCNKPFQARDESAGRRVRCPACSTILTVPGAAAAGAAGAAAPPPPAPAHNDPFSFPASPPAAPTFNPEPAAPRPAPLNPRPTHPVQNELPDEEQNSWRKFRGGLGRLKWAYVLFLLPLLAETVVFAYGLADTARPINERLGEKEGLEAINLSMKQEIVLGSCLVFGGLGLLVGLFGHLAAARAPRSSMAGRAFLGSLFFYLIAAGAAGMAGTTAVMAYLKDAKLDEPQGINVQYKEFWDESPLDEKFAPWYSTREVAFPTFVIAGVASQVLLLIGLGLTGSSLGERRIGSGAGRVVTLATFGLLVFFLWSNFYQFPVDGVVNGRNTIAPDPANLVEPGNEPTPGAAGAGGRNRGDQPKFKKPPEPGLLDLALAPDAADKPHQRSAAGMVGFLVLGLFLMVGFVGVLSRTRSTIKKRLPRPEDR